MAQGEEMYKFDYAHGGLNTITTPAGDVFHFEQYDDRERRGAKTLQLESIRVQCSTLAHAPN